MKKSKFLLLVLLAISFHTIGQVTIKKATDKTVATQPQTISTTSVNTASQTKTQGNINAEAVRVTKTPAASLTKKYNFSNVKICVDRVNNTPLPPVAPKQYPVYPTINSSGQLVSPNSVSQGLTSLPAKAWPDEQVITVAFAPNEASDFVINKVKQFAQVWEQVANIHFAFTNDWRNAMVKCGFVQDRTSWSWVGRDVMNNTFGSRTMNFGWFDNNTSDEEFSRVVTHEFGHVLGFIHEHQAPGANINWDVAKVYEFFLETNNWSPQQVDQQVFYRYNQASVNTNGYDRLSIMHYFFPVDLTTDSTMFSVNTHLSQGDKEFASEIYPFPPKRGNATGVLHTGDDCDAIQFTVQYDVVPSNVIEVVLKAGVDNAGHAITWWKQIGIPLKGGGENRNLQLNTDLKPVTQQVLVTDLDNTRGFSFAKAKVLGVHTGLGFTWKVWEGIPGGSRVTLVWQNDHCY